VGEGTGIDSDNQLNNPIKRWYSVSIRSLVVRIGLLGWVMDVFATPAW